MPEQLSREGTYGRYDLSFTIGTTPVQVTLTEPDEGDLSSLYDLLISSSRVSNVRIARTDSWDVTVNWPLDAAVDYSHVISWSRANGYNV